MVYTQSEPTNQKTDQYSSRHTKIVAKKKPKWKGFVLLPIDPQWFPWRNLCFWTFARCSHYAWRLCCRPLTYEKGWKPTRRSQHHPLVAPNYISSLLRQKTLACVYHLVDDLWNRNDSSTANQSAPKQWRPLWAKALLADDGCCVVGPRQPRTQ